jgi:uncharacterized protein
MKAVILGGTGQVGNVLARGLREAGWEVLVVARNGGDVRWDGKNPGPWEAALDGADAVVNLAGRSVNCRYSEKNLREMFDSRVDSAVAVGRAIAKAATPPRVWLQMSTATIYAHRFDAPNDEATGVIGGNEPDAPAYWRRSIEIATAWEKALEDAPAPRTRKVALRAAMVMSPSRGGIFATLLNMVRAGLGGTIAGGRQYVSWIHEADFVRAVLLLLEREDVSGPVNLAAPQPLPQREFMRTLRKAWGMPIGLPATSWMAAIGAFVLRSDTELLLKSRRVVPGRLQALGFQFRFPEWSAAAADLAARS